MDNQKVIGVMCHGQRGDILTCASVLHYRKELWGEDCRIIWFIADENRDLLKYQDIELRTFPRGFGYPEMVAEENAKLIAEGKEPIWRDWSTLVDENNHLKPEGPRYDNMLAGITHGYFPAPHQTSVERRHGINYTEISKTVFGVPMDWEWHPVLAWSEEEQEQVKEFMSTLNNPRTIAIENFCGSGQSFWDDALTRTTMRLCREHWGACNFVFVSHPDNSRFFDDSEIVSASHLSVRQCGLLKNYIDLFVGISSGVSVATSAWGLKNTVPTIQFCGSEVCSTKGINNGPYYGVFHGNDRVPAIYEQFEQELIKVLTIYK
jgi:hypothetical protein